MLEKIGLDADVSRAAARWAAGDAVLGRVVCVHRGVVSVLTEGGPLRATFGGGLLSRVAKDPTEAPCTGDWCMVRTWPDGRDTVDRLLPRRTAVLRAAAGRQSHGQVLCTNLDIVALVVALHPLPVLSKVERLLALAWESGARPLVVLTKSDLVGDADQVAEDVRAAAPDVDVVTVSVETGDGVDSLRSRLQGRLTLGLVGASGHGKSSLLNALAGAELLGTREIREDGRGRHTSVRRELVPLPGGGAVIDTPGLRGVGLLDAAEGLSLTFRDVDALAARCRFRDCAHQGEPGCRVARAIEDGDLSLRRFESWLHLQRELGWAATRAEARVRIERAKAGKRHVRRTGPAGG